MHELALCRSIARVAVRQAGGREVAVVRLRVGALRQVVPDTLAWCWTLVCESTPLAGSVFEVEHVPARLRCGSCGAERVLDGELDVACAACGDPATEVVAGEELLVTSLDVRARAAG